jgi:hypothetical protein
MTGRRIELRRAIFRLTLGILVLLLSFAPAAPTAAESSVLTGSFVIQLAISNVSASNIGLSNATISWETNGNATSQVFYDTQSHANLADYPHHSDNFTALVTQHSISLTGLSSSTTYHYSVKSVASVDNSEFIAISEDFTFKTKTSSGDGGEGGGGGGEAGGGTTSILKLEESSGLTESTIWLDSAGIAQNSGRITTKDGKVSFQIDAGTRMLDSAGQPLTLLSVKVPNFTVPSSSPNVIVMVYDFSPAGATFVPPITLIMRYNPKTLPSGVLESSLYIAYWNGVEWQAPQSKVDTQVDTVTGLVSRFTLFALMGKPAAPTVTTTSPPTPTLKPTPLPTPMPTLTPILTPTPTPTPDLLIFRLRWWLLAGLLVIITMVVYIKMFILKRPRN